ncbi:MAG: cardiolipin synthase [Prevotella sp.]|nr:cardiolipin synthase [Prevotella sp.]
MHGLNIIGVIIYWLIIVIAIIHVVMDNRQPAKTMAWALVIFFVPVAGIVLYLFFGVNHRRERLASQRSLDQLSKRSMLEFVEQTDLHVPEHYKPVVDLFINQNLSLPFKATDVDIYTNGYQFFPALLRSIASARHHIHIDFYIFEDDALGQLVSDALIDRAKAGVEVRLIYDDVGCWNIPNAFFERMIQAGIEVAPFLPVRFPSFTSRVNYRNHRKLVIIDGLEGYIGGMNIALRYVKGINDHAWRDTMIRITGGIVYSLQRAFLVDWFFVNRKLISDKCYYPKALSNQKAEGALAQIVTSGPITPYPEIMQGYIRVILAARHYIYIETPYFLPNEPVLFALKTAALAGVDVRILCPFHSDARVVEWASRSYLREAVKAGVQVFLYTAGFLHSKMLVCDDTLLTCGSTNFDFRSFENNFEANVFIYDEAQAQEFRRVFLIDQQQSISLAEIPHRMKPSFIKRLGESLVRLFAPLF